MFHSLAELSVCAATNGNLVASGSCSLVVADVKSKRCAITFWGALVSIYVFRFVAVLQIPIRRLLQQQGVHCLVVFLNGCFKLTLINFSIPFGWLRLQY